jgi:DNA-binding transcriptional LysR family regulator
MMSELTLRQLEYFAAIAETQSITEAARQCHVSQAAVSLALAQLEQAVGASLVIRRRGRGIALTSEGQVVAIRARQVVEQVADIGSAVERAHGQLSGRLTVGVFRTLASHAIAPLLDWFSHRHPAVELDFAEGSGPEVQQLMLAGAAQLSVIYRAQALPDCTTELLKPARRQAVLSPEHPLAGQKTLSLQDLAPYPAMLINAEPALQRTLAEYANAGVEPNVRWRSASVGAIHNVVGRNLAYSLLMQPAATSPEGRPLVFRPVDGTDLENPVVAALPVGVARSALVTEALTALHAQWGTSDPEAPETSTSPA